MCGAGGAPDPEPPYVVDVTATGVLRALAEVGATTLGDAAGTGALGGGGGAVFVTIGAAASARARALLFTEPGDDAPGSRPYEFDTMVEVTPTLGADVGGRVVTPGAMAADLPARARTCRAAGVANRVAPGKLAKARVSSGSGAATADADAAARAGAAAKPSDGAASATRATTARRRCQRE